MEEQIIETDDRKISDILAPWVGGAILIAIVLAGWFGDNEPTDTGATPTTQKVATQVTLEPKPEPKPERSDDRVTQPRDQALTDVVMKASRGYVPTVTREGRVIHVWTIINRDEYDVTQKYEWKYLCEMVKVNDSTGRIEVHDGNDELVAGWDVRYGGDCVYIS